MIDKFTDFVQKRPKTIIAVILIITALFLIPLSKLEVDTSPKLLSPKQFMEPVEKLEALIDMPMHGIDVIGKNNESMLSLEALKEQLILIDFVKSNFEVETQSVAEIIEKEIKENYNKSLMDMESEEELTNALYDLFEKSPENFEKAKQELLSKNYDMGILKDIYLLKSFSSLVPFSSFFIRPKEVDMPHTEIAEIYLSMKDRDASEYERKQTVLKIRESVNELDFEHIKAYHYSYILVTYDIDEKLAGNTALLAIMTIVSMSLLIFLSFRRLYFVFIPMFIIIIAIIWTFGTAVLLDLKITALHTLIIALLVGIALDGPLHLTKRFLEQRIRSNFSNSLKATLNSMIPAFFLTFLTTAGAFVAQIILPSPPALLSLALVVIIGVTYSFLLVCLLWPTMTVIKSHKPSLSSGKIVKKAMNRVFELSIKHSKIIIVILIAAFLISVYNTSNIKTDTSINMLVPEGVPVKEAIRIGGLYTSNYMQQFVMIEGDVLQPEIIPALERFEENIQDNEFLERIGKRAKFEGINTLLRQLNIQNITDLEEVYDGLYENTTIADPITKQTVADKARLFLHKNASGYHTMLAFVWIRFEKAKVIREAHNELNLDTEISGLYDIPGVKTRITGDVIEVANVDLFIRKVQNVSSILMFIFTFIILLIIYRKLSLGIIVSIPIFIGSVVSLGLMPLLGISLNWLSATVIPLIIGLGVDYGIYLAQRYKEELKKYDTKEAARIALEQTGDGLWLAAASTAIGFLIISFSFLPMAKSFGILMAISIALTFLISIFLLPVLLIKFVKK
ncbi:MMPL family transporter [Candidatus Woesearchaeota archaeon]|nr:MMPL family transporter [Candidatus Woesearchaeota archaeon]